MNNYTNSKKHEIYLVETMQVSNLIRQYMAYAGMIKSYEKLAEYYTYTDSNFGLPTPIASQIEEYYQRKLAALSEFAAHDYSNSKDDFYKNFNGVLRELEKRADKTELFFLHEFVYHARNYYLYNNSYKHIANAINIEKDFTNTTIKLVNNKAIENYKNYLENQVNFNYRNPYFYEATLDEETLNEYKKLREKKHCVYGKYISTTEYLDSFNNHSIKFLNKNYYQYLQEAINTIKNIDNNYLQSMHQEKLDSLLQSNCFAGKICKVKNKKVKYTGKKINVNV